jgi:peptidoglycan/LPS O-acetylase OafA/YrhL
LKRPELLQDYIVGLTFAGSLIGFRAVSEWFEPHLRGSWRWLRWAAGATFSIYLFHEPLLRLLATINPWPSTSWAGRILVMGGTLVLVFVLAAMTERRKDAWRRALLALSGMIGGRGRVSKVKGS